MQVMDKVLRFIKNAHRVDYIKILIHIKYIPKYIIRTYIRRNPHKYFEIGFIYQYYYKNYERMYEYYNKAMDDTNTLVQLGLYYQYINYNYKKMKEYFMKAVELGNADAMHFLGYFYYYYSIKNQW